MTIPQLARE